MARNPTLKKSDGPLREPHRGGVLTPVSSPCKGFLPICDLVSVRQVARATCLRVVNFLSSNRSYRHGTRPLVNVEVRRLSSADFGQGTLTRHMAFFSVVRKVHAAQGAAPTLGEACAPQLPTPGG